MVQWIKIRLMFILEVFLGMGSKQGDVTAVFFHADIGEYEKVYVDMPQRFKQYSKHIRKICIQLKNILFGIFRVHVHFGSI